MLTIRELKYLSSLAPGNNYFVSLFLNVDPRSNPKKDEWFKHFKNLSRETLTKMKPNVKEQVTDDIKKIERYLNDKPHGLRRGLALFSNQASGIWKVYHTAMPFSNQMVIENDPYVKPLVAMIDLYQHYLVIIVRGNRVRILVADMGQIEEQVIVFKPKPATPPGRNGGKGDMGMGRAQKKKEEIKKQLFKEVRTKINKMHHEEGINRILLGGIESGRGRFKETLPENLKKRIVGEFAVAYKAPPNDVLKLCIPLMREIEYQFEREALDELFGQKGKTSKSVLGLSDVLHSLQQGNIHKLYVMSNMVSPGMVCNHCGALTTARDRPCPYCDGDMKKVNYMLDLTIQRALEQGARIDMLEKADRLANVGGIGALLRY